MAGATHAGWGAARRGGNDRDGPCPPEIALRLTRRRSRVPWIYLLYHAPRPQPGVRARSGGPARPSGALLNQPASL
jgi:hypothetical protein